MTKRKKALISGASSGIGRATAERFASEGWDICLNALHQPELEAVCQQLAPGDHCVCAGDYSDPATADALGTLIGERWGRLDCLISCAGIAIAGHPITTPLEEWRRPLDIMLNGAIYLTRLAAPFMDEGGRIVHITSIHGERTERGAGAYGMAKAALNQYCRVLALELAPQGILVNAIAPGFVDTPMSIHNGINELESEWFKQNYIEGRHLPLRRAAQPEEIAGVAWFLAGPDATYITGQVLTVDGGLTITF